MLRSVCSSDRSDTLFVDLLEQFDERQSAGSGAEKLTFSKRGWRQVQQHCGPLTKHLDSYLNVYLVFAHGRIFTVGHRQ
jgi:hypothetical protein